MDHFAESKSKGGRGGCWVCNVFQLFKDTLNVHRKMENIDICHRVCALYYKMAVANVLFSVLRLRGDEI